MEHIFLSGLMGCGKTRLARLVAKELARPVYDLDARICLRLHTRIPVLVANQGWDEFRKQEREELNIIAKEKPGIVALGGGTLHDDNSYQLIQAMGKTIFLNVPIVDLVLRNELDTRRPLLKDCHTPQDVKNTLKKLDEERRPRYEKCDKVIRMAEQEPVEKTIKRIIEAIQQIENGHTS